MSVAMHQHEYTGPCATASRFGFHTTTTTTTTYHDRATPRRLSEDDAFPPSPAYRTADTPPESVSGSPRLKLERGFSMMHKSAPPAEYSPLVPRQQTGLATPRTSIVRLPSLDEFDQGVEAIARAHGGHVRPWTPSPVTAAVSRPAYPPPFDSFSYSSGAAAHHPTTTANPTPQAYPSPPPDTSSAATTTSSENRHINQKYTTEEGDFIIYAWHDRKLKWQRIQQDFAALFGRTPERTVQGLQAWYYRMNQRIPLWDRDGWLVFAGEDDLEPRHVSIKCRERDAAHGQGAGQGAGQGQGQGQDRPAEPLGLAQRYPERAIHYAWVDPELKRKSRDWGE